VVSDTGAGATQFPPEHVMELDPRTDPGCDARGHAMAFSGLLGIMFMIAEQGHEQDGLTAR
jgi:hypothetical protein